MWQRTGFIDAERCAACALLHCAAPAAPAVMFLSAAGKIAVH